MSRRSSTPCSCRRTSRQVGTTSRSKEGEGFNDRELILCFVCPGDLILFRTATTTACITRWCTDAPFDHVAMVLRTAEGYRTVECTGQGIGCWVLQERIEDHIIKGVVIRRLQTALTNQMVDNLNQFLQSVKHKPYRLNTSLVGRMMRTCLCCRRQGQNERGLEEYEEENQRRKQAAAAKIKAPGGKYAPEDELKQDDEREVKGADGQVHLPQLLPPKHRDAAHGGPTDAAALEELHCIGGGVASSSPTLSSDHLSVSTEEQMRRKSSSEAAAAAASSSSSASVAAPSLPSPSSVSPSSFSPRADAKFLKELKDHESIRAHYPLPEDISQLHTRSGFFCSSFIAACYMKMGLLPAYPPIDWYLPNTFSSRTAIQPPLAAGAEWGEEYLVAKPSGDTSRKKWTRPYEVRQMEKREMEMQQKKKASSGGDVAGNGTAADEKKLNGRLRAASSAGRDEFDSIRASTPQLPQQQHASDASGPTRTRTTISREVSRNRPGASANAEDQAAGSPSSVDVVASHHRRRSSPLPNIPASPSSHDLGAAAHAMEDARRVRIALPLASPSGVKHVVDDDTTDLVLRLLPTERAPRFSTPIDGDGSGSHVGPMSPSRQRGGAEQLPVVDGSPAPSPIMASQQQRPGRLPPLAKPAMAMMEAPN